MKDNLLPIVVIGLCVLFSYYIGSTTGIQHNHYIPVFIESKQKQECGVKI